MRQDVEQLIDQGPRALVRGAGTRWTEREMTVDLDDRAEAAGAGQEPLERRVSKQLMTGADDSSARTRQLQQRARVALGQREGLLDVDVRAAVERRRRRIEVGMRGRADMDHVRPSFIDQVTHRGKGDGLRETGKFLGPAGERVVHADDDARDVDALQRLEVGSRHLTGADESDANGSIGLSLAAHWMRYRRMRGPTRLVTVAGRRRQTLVMNAPEPPSVESGVTSDAIGIRYQKSGSSCAPHCRLKR